MLKWPVGYVENSHIGQRFFRWAAQEPVDDTGAQAGHAE